jgi:hypothetical protein
MHDVVLQASELPWKKPGRIGFDLSGLKNLGGSIDSFAEDFKVRSARHTSILRGPACCSISHLASTPVDSYECSQCIGCITASHACT